MRNDKKPFDDKRVRQAIALTLDRQAIVDGLFQGKADLGNDSPFAPVFPSDRHVGAAAQAEHRRGQGAARGGRRCSDGFKIELVASKAFEIPDYAQIAEPESAKEIGLKHRRLKCRRRARTTATRSSASRRG